MASGTTTGPGTAQWPVWSTEAKLVVTDPRALPPARALVESLLRQVDQAANRHRPDSELAEFPRDGMPHRISPLLAELVAAALEAANRTGGAVDPTMGGVLAALGHDQAFGSGAGGSGAGRSGAGRSGAGGSGGAGPPLPVQIRPVPGWRRVQLNGRLLTVPRDVTLDLDATTKAFTADRCAQLVSVHLRVGVLVGLGADIATAGAAPHGRWPVRLQDQPGDPASVVHLPAGWAMATSSTVSGTGRRGERLLHQVLDPRTFQPANLVWRSVTVVAERCVEASTASSASIVLAERAPAWLRHRGLPARLVGRDGRTLTVGDWPY